MCNHPPPLFVSTTCFITVYCHIHTIYWPFYIESMAVLFLHSYAISEQNICICIILFTIVYPAMFTIILCHAAIHFAY